MAKIIEFPKSKIDIENELIKKYENELKKLPAHIADCLKLSLSLLLQRGKIETPGLSITLNNNMTDKEIKEIEVILKELFENNRKIFSALLQEIATLNFNICVMKHQLSINDIAPDIDV